LSHLSYIGTYINSIPRMNLGPRWTTANNEELFVEAFADAYDNKYAWLHSGSPKLNRVMAREIPVNGFGIADLVTVSWEDLLSTCGNNSIMAEFRPTVRAFELKLSDWRKGLMQAHRYRFFADAAILVLPTNKLTVTEPFLDTFRTLNVGLWGFNTVTGGISIVFTPRPRIPANGGHRDKAITRVLGMAKQVLPSL
jgi:hypothetical protein